MPALLRRVGLAGLPLKADLQGQSLVQLLRDPTREQTVAMTYQRGNYAVRSSRWRYIGYADGNEELYDHSKNPYEISNIFALRE